MPTGLNTFRMSEYSISISQLNDFIFYHVSIYFHSLETDEDKIMNNVLWQGRQPRIKRDYINSVLDIGYTVLPVMKILIC